jgi:prepilin-type N-terminal cleavage/methylation domain-containing protein
MNSELPISRKAFSLLELLVSITLLALVSALIYGAFFQVSNSSLKVKESLSQSQELRLLMKMVLDDLQAVQYLEHFVEDEESNSQTGIISTLEWVQSIENNSSPSEVSNLSFHASVPSRFFKDIESVRSGMDPQLHEIGYFLEFDQAEGILEFKRREDFYIDNDLTEGGRIQVLSESVSDFQVEFLFREIEQAAGGSKEEWTAEFNTEERECFKTGEPPCLPRAIQLSMSLQGASGEIVSDSQVINLCVRPCKPELFE